MRISAAALAMLVVPACAFEDARPDATALVATGSIAASPLSGASRSTTGTIDQPGVSPASHPRERSEQSAALALAGLGYERAEGIDVEDDRFTAGAHRSGRALLLKGRWLDEHLGGGASRRLDDVLTVAGYADIQPASEDSDMRTVTVDGRRVAVRYDRTRRVLVEEHPAR